jgi:hypothetical protein
VGQPEKFTLTREVERTLVIENTSTEQLTTQMGLSVKNVADLKSSLTAEITNRFSQVETIHEKEERTTERTLELPKEPSDPNQLHVILRRIEHAQVYRPIRVDLLVDCSCCGLKNTMSLEVRMSTDRVALRQVDRLSDGTTRSHDLGF